MSLLGLPNFLLLLSIPLGLYYLVVSSGKINKPTQKKITFVSLVILFFIIGNGTGYTMFFDGIESGGHIDKHGYPLYWEKVTETHYVDGRAVIDHEVKYPVLFLNVLIYIASSAIFVYGSDKVIKIIRHKLTK
jgi:hypothetical protein